MPDEHQPVTSRAGRVFIAGGSGFVGSEVVDTMLKHGREVVVLARRPLTLPYGVQARITVVQGNATATKSLRKAMENCSAVINSVGIIKERRLAGITFERLHYDVTCNLLDEAQRAGVKHFLQISALGARPGGVSRYQTTKHLAEEAVKRSPLNWTIFRPSLVIGPGKGFLSTIRSQLRSPIVPVIGSGDYRFEPIDKRVLAEAVDRSIGNETVFGKILDVRGPESYSYNSILDVLGEALGKKRVRKIHLPPWLVKPFVWAFGRLPLSPVTIDQLNMLLEGSTGNGPNAVDILGLESVDFKESIHYALGGGDQKQE